MSRCPRCSAAVAETAVWCSLCYADLRPAPVPVAQALAAEPAERAEQRVRGHRAGGDSKAPKPEAPIASGRHARGRTPAPAAEPGDVQYEIDADALDEELFALLREQHGPDPLSRWGARLADPKFRWGLAAGGAFALITVLVLVATVFGTAF